MSATRPIIPRGMRRTIGVLASVLTALTVVLITAAVLATGLLRPAPQAQPLPATGVDVGAGPLELICPDAPRLSTGAAGVDIDYDAEFDTEADQMRTATQAVVLQAAEARPEHVALGPLDQAGEPAVSGPDATVVSAVDNEAAAVLTAPPAQGLTPRGAGQSVARTDGGDLRGLDVAACGPPSTTQWLVGGSTGPGTSARLLLSNAGLTPVSATVHLWGETGAVAGTTELLVPPQASRSVLLETVSQEERLAVQVSADGGHLTATIQDSALRGVVPAGTDTITWAADPASVLNLGPVLVTEPEAQDSPPVLRLVNPATERTTISVDLLTDDGPRELPGAQEQVLEPGTVTDISLSGVGAGPMALQVHADQPVTGSLLRTVVGQAGDLDPSEPVRDRAWLAAQSPAERGVLGVPQELVDEVHLVVANPLPRTQQVQVRPIDAQGVAEEPVTVDIPAGAALQVDQEQVPMEGVVALELTGPAVLAAVMADGHAPDGPLLAMLGLTPDAAAAQQVDVRVGSN